MTERTVQGHRKHTAAAAAITIIQQKETTIDSSCALQRYLSANGGTGKISLFTILSERAVHVEGKPCARAETCPIEGILLLEFHSARAVFKAKKNPYLQHLHAKVKGVET